MSITQSKGPIFKKYLTGVDQYRGGSTRGEMGQILYKLSSNENLLGPSPKALKVIQDNIERLNEYEFENDRCLRRALSFYFNNQLLAHQFLTGNGGMELLDLVCRAFLFPGDEVIICSPTFMAYKNFAKLNGAKVFDVPLLSPDYQLDIEGILQNVSNKTKLLFLTSPNNPTGTVIPGYIMDELMERLPRHVVVVYDEVYHHYVETRDYARAMDYINAGYNIIGLHSFSKAFGLAGLRIAYLFSTQEISDYLQKMRRPFMVNTLSVVAAIAALEDNEHIKATYEVNLEAKRMLYGTLSAKGINFQKTEANFILVKPAAGAIRFVERLQESGILVRSAEPMGAAGCVRISIGTCDAMDYLKHQL